MQPLNLDFGSRPTSSGLAAWLLLASGTLASAVALDAHLAAREDLARLGAKVERQRQMLARTEKAAARAPHAASPATDAEAPLRRIAGELSIPWDGVLEALELAIGDQVALLAVAVEGKGRELRLEGEARSLAEALEFAQRLRDSLRFEDVALSRHEEKQAGAVVVVRFQMRAVWSAS